MSNVGKLATGAAAIGGSAAASIASVAGPEAELAVGAFTKGLTIATATVDKFISTMQTFVQALNPSAVDRFNYRMDNLTAAFGVAFEPMLEEAGKLADTLNGVVTPAAHAIASAFELIVPIIEDVSHGFVKFLEYLFDFQKSYTTAARAPEFKSFQQYGNDLITASLKSTSGSDVNTEGEKTNDILENIYNLLAAPTLGAIDRGLDAGIDTVRGWFGLPPSSPIPTGGAV